MNAKLDLLDRLYNNNLLNLHATRLSMTLDNSQQSKKLQIKSIKGKRWQAWQPKWNSGRSSVPLSRVLGEELGLHSSFKQRQNWGPSRPEGNFTPEAGIAKEKVCFWDPERLHSLIKGTWSMPRTKLARQMLWEMGGPSSNQAIYTMYLCHCKHFYKPTLSAMFHNWPITHGKNMLRSCVVHLRWFVPNFKNYGVKV